MSRELTSYTVELVGNSDFLTVTSEVEGQMARMERTVVNRCGDGDSPVE